MDKNRKNMPKHAEIMKLTVPTGTRGYRNAVVHFHISIPIWSQSCLRSLIKAPLPVVPSNWSAVMFSDPINPAP